MQRFHRDALASAGETNLRSCQLIPHTVYFTLALGDAPPCKTRTSNGSMEQSDRTLKAFSAFRWTQNRCTQKTGETTVENASRLTCLLPKMGSSSDVLSTAMRQDYLPTPSLWSLELFSTHRHVFSLVLAGNGRRMGVWRQRFPANVRFPTLHTPRHAPATF